MTKEKAEHYIACAVAQLIICLPLWFVSVHQNWKIIITFLAVLSIVGLWIAIDAWLFLRK